MISETELETKVLMEKTIVSLEKKLQRIVSNETKFYFAD